MPRENATPTNLAAVVRISSAALNSNLRTPMNQQDVTLGSAAQSAAAATASGGAEHLTSRQRKVLAALADLLIPAGERMPCASDAGVHQRGVDMLLVSRPDLSEGLRQALDRASDLSAREALERLRGVEKGRLYGILTDAVVGAYYMNSETLVRLGYPGQRQVAIANPALDAEDEDLVRSVTARGSIYREC